jgi:hypothetical protein
MQVVQLLLTLFGEHFAHNRAGTALLHLYPTDCENIGLLTLSMCEVGVSRLEETPLAAIHHDLVPERNLPVSAKLIL